MAITYKPKNNRVLKKYYSVIYIRSHQNIQKQEIDRKGQSDHFTPRVDTQGSLRL